MSDIKKIIESTRHDYNLGELNEKNVKKNPFEQFTIWMDDAIENNLPEPNAMNLATAGDMGRISSRIVLLRNYSEHGFSFFTNYGSKKSNELAEGKFCALNFFWQNLQRQVRIEGPVRKLAAKESDDYFASRPRESQLGAHASAQSLILKNRDELEERFKNLTSSFDGKPIPRPVNWGGFLVVPDLFEFWQGRPNRLHDRIQYILKNGQWVIDRLYP